LPPVVARGDIPPVAAGAPPPMISMDRAAQIAQQTFPDLEASFVRLPSNAYSHIGVGGRGSYPLLFESMSINPYAGAVENTRRVSDRSGLELVTESMRPLHTGDFAGTWLKLVYCFFGLLLSMMVFSGMMIWTKRTVKETVAATRRRAPAVAGKQAPAAMARATAGGRHE